MLPRLVLRFIIKSHKAKQDAIGTNALLFDLPPQTAVCRTSIALPKFEREILMANECLPSPCLQKLKSSVAPPSAFEINLPICWLLFLRISAGMKSFCFSMALILLVSPYVKFSSLANSVIKYSNCVIISPSSPGRMIILVPTAVLGSHLQLAWRSHSAKAASRSDLHLAWLKRASKSPMSWHSADCKSSVDLLNVTNFFHCPLQT